jgi:hypothetical protein
MPGQCYAINTDGMPDYTANSQQVVTFGLSSATLNLTVLVQPLHDNSDNSGGLAFPIQQLLQLTRCETNTSDQ